MSETTGGDGRPRYYIQTPGGGFIETSKPGYIEADIPCPYHHNDEYIYQLVSERDEARRWARMMMLERNELFDGQEYWHDEYTRVMKSLQDTLDLWGRCQEKNDELRAEVERLKHLLPPPQMPHDGVVPIGHPLAKR